MKEVATEGEREKGKESKSVNGGETFIWQEVGDEARGKEKFSGVIGNVIDGGCVMKVGLV